jgi:hypothetical protein
MERSERMRQWLAPQFPGRRLDLAPASADASFRRYFRLRLEDGATWIVMDAPPEHEDCRPFVRVAGLMEQAGLHVPHVAAQDMDAGFLLLEDLGARTYLEALDAGSADALFDDAIEALLRWQLATRPGVLPPYDEALLRRELELFPDWYVARHLGVELGAAQRGVLDEAFALLVASALAQSQVFVHRDYMPRNLMVSQPNPGVLDFQDAVLGPVTYDVVSLFRDAFLSWDEERVLEWTIRYWERAKRAGLPVEQDFGRFYRDFEWMGLQRHLKVLGIFARINYRDGKPHYLTDTPRFVGYVRKVAGRYREFGPLLQLFDELEIRPVQAGAAF